ncbi:uncharacterized protein LOC120043125 isoform X2 [Salvelinus namaycush]|uniref:Uncharacterized protein LOC120043125 isoform X2 n=1 Tax=Salvelinus namaycush TaxID=8040 RepID=A0A8U0QI49_SALNM|nr:uncharacterized protein LOC120043125 isoform X2 [Salvelinus namaycush]
MMGVLNHLSTLLLLSLLPPALSHVVKKFSDVPQCKSFFLKGTTPNLPGILVGGIFKDDGPYKPICQKYKNFYRFATLYDTYNRIPVFSAYTFTGNTTGRPIDRWMIEPGVVSFNDGSWKTMEGNVRGTLKLNCKDANDQIKAYVVTGAVPNNNKTKLNNRVNIPYLMWTAYCCENKKYKKNKKWMAGAYWGENKKGTGALDQQTLGALEIMLNRYYKGKDGPVKVFPEDCPRGPKPTTSP